MIFCAKCESENRETASFCLTCGAKLEQPEEILEVTDASPNHQEEVIALPADPLEGIIVEAERKESASPAAVLESDARDQTLQELGPELSSRGESDLSDQAGSELTPSDAEPVLDLEMEPEGELLAPELEASEAVLEITELPEGSETQEPESSSEALLPPLDLGTLLNGRYEIVALLEKDLETLLYDALDHGRCGQCGFADSLPDDLYCANCGALLRGVPEPPHVHLRALRVAGEAIIQLEEESEGRVECWLEAGGQLYAVLPLPDVEPEAEPPTFERGVRHVVGYSSDVGLQRELDEDALLALTLAPMFESESRPSLGLYAVADGMGGHEGGEVASRLAVQTLSEIMATRLLLPELAGEPVLPETPAEMFREAVEAINTRLFELQQRTGSDMGTTLTAALIRDDLALIANVGDSRTYLWRDGQLCQITLDHSLVAQLVAAEMIEPHEIYSHPEKSAIYRSLGHMPEVDVDIFPHSLLPGDRLLLCCDGVWEMLRDEGIEEVLLSEVDPQRASDEIVRRSNLAGGEDNISVVIVLFEELESQ